MAGTADGTPDRVLFNVVQPIGDVRTEVGASALERAFRNQSVQPPGADPWNDEWEAPFAALIRAATDSRVSWRQDSGIRLIIHIADAGNQALNQPSPAQVGRLLERVSRD